jgi:hypothetical protein
MCVMDFTYLSTFGADVGAAVGAAVAVAVAATAAAAAQAFLVTALSWNSPPLSPSASTPPV